jgi:hypothetical protein
MPRGIGHCAKQAYACVIGGRRWGLRAGATAAGVSGSSRWRGFRGGRLGGEGA